MNYTSGSDREEVIYKYNSSICVETMTTKIIHMIRHGESEANQLMNDSALAMGYEDMQHGMMKMNNTERAEMMEPLFNRKEIDYNLTDMGYKQACYVQTDTDIQKDITLIISSTQERAIRTAAVGFGHLIKSGQARGVALDSAREFITGEPGECRTSISNRLKDPMFHAGWDFSNCSDEDIMWKTMEKNNKFEMSWKNDSGEMQPMWMQPNLRNSIRKRGTEVLNFIFDQNDKVIALFTHAGFASMGIIRGRLKNDTQANELFRGNFKNCDRVTMKVTKTNNNKDPKDNYKFEIIGFRKCSKELNKLYPTKTIHLIRHGESEQNKIMSDYAAKLGIADAVHAPMTKFTDEQRFEMISMLRNGKKIDYNLSEKGYKQAELVQSDVDIQKGLTLIVASTQERAIRTAAIGLGHLIKSGQARAVALDSAREALSDETGERRSKVSDRLKDPMFETGWDFSNVTEDDELYMSNMKNNTFELKISNGKVIPPYENDRVQTMIEKRGTATLDFIFKQTDDVVALVTHGMFTLFGILHGRLRNNKIDFRAKENFANFMANYNNCDRRSLKVTKTNHGYEVVLTDQRKCPPVKANRISKL